MHAETLESGPPEVAPAPAELAFHGIFVASYRRLVVQLYGVTGDAVRPRTWCRRRSSGPRPPAHGSPKWTTTRRGCAPWRSTCTAVAGGSCATSP
jgi:hypothetical protein